MNALFIYPRNRPRPHPFGGEGTAIGSLTASLRPSVVSMVDKGGGGGEK